MARPAPFVALARIPHLLLLSVWAWGSARVDCVGTGLCPVQGEPSSPIHGVMLSGFSREASRARHRDLSGHFPIAMRNRAEAGELP